MTEPNLPPRPPLRRSRRGAPGGAHRLPPRGLPADGRPADGRPAGGGPGASAGAANVQVSRDQYREHVGPSLAVNPSRPRQLLAACQGSPFTPEFVLTYLSADGGASWHQGGSRPSPRPAGWRRRDRRLRRERPRLCLRRALWSRFRPQPGEPGCRPRGVPVADRRRRAELLRASDPDRGQLQRSPLGGAGQGQNSSGHNVYVAWGAGASHTAVDFTRSADGGQSFEAPRRILAGGRDSLAGERGSPGGRGT